MCACSLRQHNGFGSPRPSAGEGLGVRGNPIEWISTRNLALDEGLEPCGINQPCARPLSPGPSPALGRGEPKSIEFLDRQRVSSLYYAILK